MLTIERLAYQGWPGSWRLANEQVELVALADVGPRIIRFGFQGRDNLFREFEGSLGMTGGDEWRIYGGHRLWHAPEASPRTYYPDNSPAEAARVGDLLRITQATETATGIQKELEIWLDPDFARARITHRLWNRGLWAVDLAAWALSVMAPGGVAIAPLPPRAEHSPENLLPTSAIALWPYTDLADPRWVWGSRAIMLRQDETARTPQKAGFWVPDGWAAYARQGCCFVKRFSVKPAAPYPDRGSCVEFFTNHELLEVETLGPLTRLEPGAALEHTEEWLLFDGLPPDRPGSQLEAEIRRRINAQSLEA